MKKYWIVLISILCLLVGAASAIGAQAHLNDQAALLTAEESETLTLYLEQIGTDQNIDIAVVTVNSIGDSSLQDFADDYYDENGFGEDGILLLVDMGSRGYWISTSGICIRAFSDEAISEIGEELVAYLADGYYMDALCVFAEDVETYMSALYEGESEETPAVPYEELLEEDEFADSGIDPRGWGVPKKNVWQESGGTIILIAVLLGAAAAFIVTAGWKGQLRSVRFASDAAGYEKQGSFILCGREDRFLYKNVTRVAKPKDPPPNHSNGGSTHIGGGSTHVSSGGHTHGGGGGHF